MHTGYSHIYIATAHVRIERVQLNETHHNERVNIEAECTK